MFDGSKSGRFLSRYLMSALTALIVVLVLACEISRAQETVKRAMKTKHLGLHLGIGMASFREDLIVPLGFSGPDLSLGAVYTRQTDKNLVNLRLRIGLGHLENRFSHEAWVAMLEIRSSWLKKLTQHHRYGELWAGICTPMQMNNLFVESWDDSHLYWLTAHSLGAAAQWQKEISQKTNAVIRMETPLLSLVSRPPAYRHNKQDALNHFTFHFTEPNRSLHLETLDTYKALLIQMVFSRKRGDSLFNFGFEFQYNYCRKPERIWRLTSSVILTYQWRIGK